MILYIMRHGETTWNSQGRLQGQADIDLNENGISLAKVSASRLKDISFDLGITSPLIRAKRTAQLILEGRNVPLLEDERLMELSFGSWEGLGCHADNFEIPSSQFSDFYKNPFSFRPAEDGETISALCERTKAFYDELVSNSDYADKSILITTHGCASRALLYNVNEKKSDFWMGCVPKNCAVSVVEIKNGKGQLLEQDKIYYDEKDGIDYYSMK